ncbi:MAG TPA: ROK family transcriptional regulator [Victivallales bacterium]|nr:ROK family transcriptional regulator [Victivallales bacterium]
MEFVTGKPQLIKKINKNIIFKLIMRNETISRSKIAASTALAMPTVMRIVQELLDEGLVIEIGSGDSSGGRKPSMLSLKPNAFYFIGLELTSEIKGVVANLKGDIIAKSSAVSDFDGGPEAIFKQINNIITIFQNLPEIVNSRIAGVGIGIPGTNFRTSSEIENSIFKGWESLELEKMIKKDLPFPVIFDNISKTKTLGELWFGNAKKYKNFIYIFAENGIGSGIVINGDLLYGNNNDTGEFGHTVINYNGPECYCGNKGCLEMYSSLPAIITKISNSLNIDRKKIDLEFMKSEINRKNDIVINIIKEAGRLLGVGIANYINLFDPQVVVLGGGLNTEIPIYFEEAKNGIVSHVFYRSFTDEQIVPASMNTQYNCLGAVSIIVNEMFKSIQL